MAAAAAKEAMVAAVGMAVARVAAARMAVARVAPAAVVSDMSTRLSLKLQKT